MDILICRISPKNPSKESGKIGMLIRFEKDEDKVQEQMEVIKKDNPVTLTKYEVEKGLIDQNR